MISRKKREAAEKLRHHIFLNYNKPLNFLYITDMVCYSEAYCRRIFKEVYNKSMKEYQQELRLKEAAHLLETTNLKCYRITMELGYNKSQDFMQLFKSKYGMTMRQYRISKWASRQQSTLRSTAQYV